MKSSIQDKDKDKDKEKTMTAFYMRASLRLIVLSYQLLTVQFILSHVDASTKIYTYTLKSPISFTHLKTNITHTVFFAPQN